MTQDTPPQDEEILNLIRASVGGLAPSVLIQMLQSDYSDESIIQAVQRVFDRRSVTFSHEAKLIENPVAVKAAA